MSPARLQLIARTGHPDFLDLPWDEPLAEWTSERLVEVVRGGGYGEGSDVAFMLDQCHNIEDKIPGQIRSVLNVQEMTARALLVRVGVR